MHGNAAALYEVTAVPVNKPTRCDLAEDVHVDDGYLSARSFEALVSTSADPLLMSKLVDHTSEQAGR